MSGIPRPHRDPTKAALELVTLAHRVSTGEVSIPRVGQGPEVVGDRIVVDSAVHAIVCGWTTSMVWEAGAGHSVALRECLGCGLLRRVEGVDCAPDPPPDGGEVAAVLPIRRAAQ